MTCDSCGADSTELHPVQRVYVVADGPNRVLDEVERWCVACLTHYPHEPA
jgi:hypothetical protein